MLELYAQIWIGVLGSSAIWLVGSLGKWKRWGYIVGLCSQPAWFYTAIINEQWGIFALALFYTYSWLHGVYNYWLKE